MEDLRSTIYYYENVADSKGNAGRASSITTIIGKLRGILETIELEIKGRQLRSLHCIDLTRLGNHTAIDEQLDKTRDEAATMLDCPELKQVQVRHCHAAQFYSLSGFQYDLRVVFIHDGLYGRKHLYNYVYDKGQWWKIADSLIERVLVTHDMLFPPILTMGHNR